MDVIRWPTARFFAGLSRIDITPPVGIYHRMWGAASHDRSTGIHRPLTATALALRSMDANHPEQTRYLLAIDHCLLWPKEMNELRSRIAAHCDIDANAVLVCFSHTHGAGLMGRERAELPGGEMIGDYLDELAVRGGRALELAIATQVPATMILETGQCDLGANRDYWDATSNQSVCGFNPEGIADDTLVVGRIKDADEKLLGTIVNYACHPTTLAWDNTLISPDYIGAMREIVEHETEAPCLFILGACGDIGPREGFVGDTKVADRNGRRIGYAALAALEAMPPSSDQNFAYSGPVTSGATIGTWDYAAKTEHEKVHSAAWHEASLQLDLPYREEPLDGEKLRAEREQWMAKEQAATEAGNHQAAADARAIVERATRRIVRDESLPKGDSYPYRPDVWRVGDCVWVMLDGEHYNRLQVELRERFPEQKLIIGTVINGSSVWYLPDRESFGKGLYQEQASVLAPGSLETVIESIAEAIAELNEVFDADAAPAKQQPRST